MKIISEENFIKELEKKYSIHNSLIISNDKTLKNKTNLKTFTINELCEYLIKKSPLLFTPYITSKHECIFIINSLIKDIFKKNNALFNLTKTPLFSKEIHNIFKTFYNSSINPEILKNCIKKNDLSEEDFSRLNLILEVYEEYTKQFKEQKIIDHENLCNETVDILQKNSRHLEIVKENCQNILIDNSIELTFSNEKLLNLIGTNIKLISIKKKYQNIITEKFSTKYLHTLDNNTPQNSSFSLLTFNDINDEINFIIQTIIQKINQEKYTFSDFIIALANSDDCKTFNNILMQNNIPTNHIQSDEKYDLFIIKLNQYLNICENKYKLTNTQKLSKSTIEQLQEDINLNFENIISETFENQFIKDKLLLAFGKNLNQNLIEFIEENSNLLTLEDEKKLKEEIDKIRELFNLYKQNNACQFISCATKNLNLSLLANKNIAQIIKKINSLEKIFSKKNIFATNPQILREIINSPFKKNSDFATDCIEVITIQEAQSRFSKILFLPNLTEKSIPIQNNIIQLISPEANNILNNELKKYDKNYKSFILNSNEQIQKSAKAFINTISQGQEEIIFSTHKYENKKQVIPSIFFEYLKTLLPIENIDQTTAPKEQNVENNISLKEKTNENIINENDLLKLSASGISNFQTCPRKFYFANLLGLKTTSAFCATYGTIVHTIFENFNKNYLNSYKKETLLSLSNILFNSNTNPQTAITAGFSQKDVNLITATDMLSLAEMKIQFEEALDELEKYGFFTQIPDEIICEKSFKFIHPSINNVIFDGRIDAIYKFGNEYKIIDFKTGADKAELSYLISENGVNFKTKTGKETNVEIKQNQYEYQIPLYYLASQYSEDLNEIKDKVTSIGLFYIRPKNKHNGTKTDIIETEKIGQFETKLIQNLKETIIDKIKNKVVFTPKANEMSCKNCAFNNLCELNLEEEND